ncbi:hypothetical protein GQR58_004082 [Nymphon striatum]|nr:hypothetical protein GQR58_004082 [Nymphon striatum]
MTDQDETSMPYQQVPVVELCYEYCVDEGDFFCHSFSYCMKTGSCIISTISSLNMNQNNTVEEDSCYIASKKYQVLDRARHDGIKIYVVDTTNKSVGLFYDYLEYIRKVNFERKSEELVKLSESFTDDKFMKLVDCNTRDHLSSYVESPGIILQDKGFKTVTAKDANTCAETCSDMVIIDNCESFDWCESDKNCVLHSTHILDVKSSSGMAHNAKCSHYSKDFMLDYISEGNKKMDDEAVSETYENLSGEECAKECSLNDKCNGYDYCQADINTCRITTLHLGDSKLKTSNNKNIVNNYVEDVTNESIAENYLKIKMFKTLNLSILGAVAGAAIGMIALGAIISAIAIFTVVLVFHKYQNVRAQLVKSKLLADLCLKQIGKPPKEFIYGLLNTKSVKSLLVTSCAHGITTGPVLSHSKDHEWFMAGVPHMAHFKGSVSVVKLESQVVLFNVSGLESGGPPSTKANCVAFFKLVLKMALRIFCLLVVSICSLGFVTCVPTATEFKYKEDFRLDVEIVDKVSRRSADERVKRSFPFSNFPTETCLDARLILFNVLIKSMSSAQLLHYRNTTEKSVSKCYMLPLSNVSSKKC